MLNIFVWFDFVSGSEFHNPPLCELYCTESEWRHPTDRKIYGTLLFFMQYVAPCVVIATSYGIIARHFNSSSSFRRQRNSSESRVSIQWRRISYRRQRTNRLLSAMVITFAVATAPLALFNLLNDYGAIPKLLQRQKYFVHAIGHLSAALSTTIDPILYVMMNRKFSETVPARNQMPTAIEQQIRKNFYAAHY